MKKVTYGIAWICVVLLVCMAYYGSYELSEKRERNETRWESQTQVVTGGGKNEYLLKEENGEVLVYQSDGKTLYESTGIQVSGLPQEMQNEIAVGKTIEDSATLYSFLENYSS